MTNPTRKPGDPGHVGDICNALHDRVHVEPGLHPNPRWGPSRSRMSKTKRVRIAVAVDPRGETDSVILGDDEFPIDSEVCLHDLFFHLHELRSPVRVTVLEGFVEVPEFESPSTVPAVAVQGGIQEDVEPMDALRDESDRADAWWDHASELQSALIKVLGVLDPSEEEVRFAHGGVTPPPGSRMSQAIKIAQDAVSRRPRESAQAREMHVHLPGDPCEKCDPEEPAVVRGEVVDG